MRKLWSNSWLVMAFMLGGASFAIAAPARMPRPGSLNSVQGQVRLNGRSAWPSQSETVPMPEVIGTRHGKAELLLTPGSYLRIGDDSEARVVTRSLANTTVKVVRGTALLDARATFTHDLTILMDNTRTTIEKKGVYGFNANQQTISVLSGKAKVYQGDSRVTLKGKHQLQIASQTPLEINSLNVRDFKSSPLYQWNQVRSKYESKAKKSVQEAISQSGHWYGPGWYWSRFWGFYTYLPSPGGSYYYSSYYPYYGSYVSPAWGNWGGDWGWGGFGWGGDDDDGD